jgi:hypothetical protein
MKTIPVFIPMLATLFLALAVTAFAQAPAEGTMRLAGVEKPVAFRLRPNEIKTFRIPLDKAKAAFETNLLER